MRGVKEDPGFLVGAIRWRVLLWVGNTGTEGRER